MKIILDVDTGIDDALALAYVLASPEAELIGITGTYGNVTIDTGIRNDLDLLALFGCSGVPVFRGAAAPSTKSGYEVHEDSGSVHGRNGLADVQMPVHAAQAPEAKSGVDFIIDSVRAYGDDLVVVPTGPSTTVDAALAAAPDIVDKIHIVAMCGSLTQLGNVGPDFFAEANVYSDPEATNRLFASGADITMVGLDVTMRTLLTKEQTNRWRQTGSPAGVFLADMSDRYYDVMAQLDPDFAGGSPLHDPLAAGIAIDPSLVTMAYSVDVSVELEGPGRGRTLVNPARLFEPTKTKVALAVDSDRFVQSFVERIEAFVSRVR